MGSKLAGIRPALHSSTIYLYLRSPYLESPKSPDLRPDLSLSLSSDTDYYCTT